MLIDFCTIRFSLITISTFFFLRTYTPCLANSLKNGLHGRYIKLVQVQRNGQKRNKQHQANGGTSSLICSEHRSGPCRVIAHAIKFRAHLLGFPRSCRLHAGCPMTRGADLRCHEPDRNHRQEKKGAHGATHLRAEKRRVIADMGRVNKATPLAGIR